MRRLENELVTTLERAAGRAPMPEPGFLDQLERRYKRKRRSRVAAVAAATALVVTGSAVGLGLLGGSGVTSTLAPAGQPASPPARQAVTGGIEPVEKVWPAAVHTIPNRLPDGRKFQPQTMIDDQTVLVSAQSSFEKAKELWAYDIVAKTARKVTDISTPADAKIFASNFTIGEGHVAWWLGRSSGRKHSIELWAAPLAGGEAHRVATLSKGAGVEKIQVIDQKVVWSVGGGGVYEAPLSGGDATLIPGTTKFALVAWPWVGSPVTKRESWSGAPPDAIVHRTLRNLKTGEERVATDRDGAWTCAVRWCQGQVDGTFIQRRDGSQRRHVGLEMTERGPAADRFGLAYDRDSAVIHDFDTGKAGRMAESDGFRMLVDDRLYYTKLKDGYQLLDLAMIDRQ
ncbi:hypothetical protein [Actinopolymorpha alba]|uniref:hypothetical protein n=1 Tax=Actinopolymorpha alba TaxID=533267 RepID=UPI000362FB08|nr:hypothetical protein [Actinopolymorpha alba]